jgi:hypothetical protein
LSLQTSLDFFDLEIDFTISQLKEKYFILAKKFHPDTGEYSSDDVFIEVLKHKVILENFLHSKITHVVAESDYKLYKVAKQIENEAIRMYFGERKNNFNNSTPEIETKLKNQLFEAKILYEKLKQEFPKSIWLIDSEDSIESINNWLGKN